MSLLDAKLERYSYPMTKKSSPTKQTLTLHGLLGALSFWGTATRALLFGFLAVVVFIVALSEATTNAQIDTEMMILIYVLGSFLLLDFGYVLIARAYPLQKAVDILALFLADIFLAVLYIAPKVVVNSEVNVSVDPLVYVFFIPLIALALRMLVGILFGGRRI
jgi:hypothetical protein